MTGAPKAGGPAVQVRNIPRGETLQKQGSRPTHVYIIQAGLFSIVQSRGDKTIEIAQLAAPQCIGEEILFGPPMSGLSAIALRDSKVVEIPVELLKQAMPTLRPEHSLVLKALFERAKSTFNELKNQRISRENTACPGNNTAKVFGVIYHSVRTLGKAESEHQYVAPWTSVKSYADEVFEESVTRLEQAVDILVKLGYAELTQADAKGDQLIHLKEMNQVESFFDFYGNYHFKGGYAEFLRTNEKATKITQAFLEVAQNYPPDRAGNVVMPYKPTVDAMKKILGNSFEADQLFRLEQKGLFMKRTTTQDGGTLSFYKPDYEQMLLNWRVLRQVELWNQQGYVDMTGVQAIGASSMPASPEEQARAERERWARRLSGWKPVAFAKPIQLRSGKPKLGEIWCQVCMSVVKAGQEYCEVCGVDLREKKPA